METLAILFRSGILSLMNETAWHYHLLCITTQPEVMVISPGENVIALAMNYPRPSINLWDFGTDAQPRLRCSWDWPRPGEEPHDNQLEGLAFSSDGRLFAACDNQFVMVWEMPGLEFLGRSNCKYRLRLGPVDECGILSMTFSADNRSLRIRIEKGLVFLDLETGYFWMVNATGDRVPFTLRQWARKGPRSVFEIDKMYTSNRVAESPESLFVSRWIECGPRDLLKMLCRGQPRASLGNRVVIGR